MPIVLEEKDASHLRTLGICAYIYAGLEFLMSLVAILYMGIGLWLALEQKEPMGWMFFGVGLLLGLWVIAMTVLTILSARWMGQGKRWTFCLVIACIHCISFPFGLALGIFSILVLVRPSVKNWFVSRAA
jgi:hypothetical protein